MGFPMRCDVLGSCRLKLRSKFQSLMGFPMRCDMMSFCLSEIRQTSFNPLWVFQCAATPAIPGHIYHGKSFNPLWVFQCAATLLGCRALQLVYRFQSLMGFPMRCDSCIHISRTYLYFLFQSLMGFPMRCDL